MLCPRRPNAGIQVERPQNIGQEEAAAFPSLISVSDRRVHNAMHGVQCGLMILARIPLALKSPSIQTSGRDVDNAMHGVQCGLTVLARIPLALEYPSIQTIDRDVDNATHGVQCALIILARHPLALTR